MKNKAKISAAAAYYESIKGNFDYTVESGHMTGFNSGWEACEAALKQEEENEEIIPETFIKRFLEEASDFFRGK